MGAGIGGSESIAGQSRRRKAQLGCVHSHTMSPIQFLVGHSSAGLTSRVTSGVSELHLRPKLGPTVGPVEAVVVVDAEEPMGETQGGHQQGDA